MLDYWPELIIQNSMEAIDKMGSFSYYATYAIAAFVSLMPVVSFFGHIFTSEGRKSLKEMPLLVVYFLLFFPFAYMFWFDLETLQLYMGMQPIWIKVIYVISTFAPLLNTDAVE